MCDKKWLTLDNGDMIRIADIVAVLCPTISNISNVVVYFLLHGHLMTSVVRCADKAERDRVAGHVMDWILWGV